MPLFVLAGVLVTAAFTLFAAILATRQKAQESLIDDLTAEVHGLKAQFRLQANYIVDLRGHIFEGKPPPPPAWPDGLTR